MKLFEGIAIILASGIFIAILLMIGPALLIWSVNELVEQAGGTLQIPFNFWTWLSGFVLLFLLKPNVSVSKK